MIMTLNDLLTKQNVFTKLALASGDKELSKALKVKLMRIRMAYAKVKKNFDDEVKEFTEELLTEDYKTLANKTDRTEEEETRFIEMTNSINSEYQEFLIQKGTEEVELAVEDSFSIDEYSDILDINSSNEVEINGNKMAAVDFMEAVYDLFVKED